MTLMTITALQLPIPLSLLRVPSSRLAIPLLNRQFGCPPHLLERLPRNDFIASSEDGIDPLYAGRS